MAFYTEEYLAKRRKKWIDSLTLFPKRRPQSRRLPPLPRHGSSGKITAVRVYDSDGVLAGSATVNIEHTSVQNTLLKFVLPIKEV